MRMVKISVSRNLYSIDYKGGKIDVDVGSDILENWKIPTIHVEATTGSGHDDYC